MRFIPFICALGLCLPTLAFASDLPRVDFVKAYLKERKQVDEAAALADFDDRYWADRLLAPSHLPATPYTEPAAFDADAVDESFRRAAASLGTMERPLYLSDAWHILQWDLGFIKARPGDLLVPYKLTAYGAEHAGLNAVKAGVEADIFNQALVVFGNPHSTVAAKYAVAAQILRDRIRTTNPDKYAVRNIRPDVLERFMALPTLQALLPYDADYLRTLLEGEVERHTVARTNYTGTREIATPFRIARVAAAYRDNQSYLAAPCHPDGRHREGIASTDPTTGPMCFVDANDRAVYAWYNQEFRRQAGLIRDREPMGSPTATLLALLVPFGAVMDVLAAAEFVETLAAEDLAVSGELEEDEALAYEDRVEALTCRAL